MAVSSFSRENLFPAPLVDDQLLGLVPMIGLDGFGGYSNPHPQRRTIALEQERGSVGTHGLRIRGKISLLVQEHIFPEVEDSLICDLGRYIEALKIGEEAHALLPNNFRPCTLLGAIHMEMGEVSIAHEWYRKAEERGVTPDSIESELRSLPARMTAEKREEAIGELLRTDPVRYRWLQKKPVGKERRRG
ncbi:tetratricopeptide repeat protein [Azotobacter chroococcum]|uniref:tetratricopeptide repeat protein n=1 Tax=Azotobacter chroococcum TaxID=353 RepID=UPI0013F1795A|nr:hypothetical protein [Azotobacter chroococcum]